jgi:2-dehydropantoate 2-reductase
MKILIYGAGAVGLGVGSFLIKAGETLTLLARPQTTESLRTNGLKRTGLFGEFFALPKQFQAVSSLSQLPAKTFDHILICTKSFDSAAAATDLKNHPQLWNQKTCFVLCQNGWGNAEIFSEHLPQELIYSARIITGFERPAPHHVNITVHAEAIHLGNLFRPEIQGLTPLAQAFSTGGIPTVTVPNISKDLWAKMLYNCALNSLGAICDVPYGQLGESDLSRSLMEEIFKEIFLVMAASGYATHWPTAKEYAKMFYAKFLPATASHRSSTLQDIHAGRRTEIDALNGVVVHLARRHGVPAPVNQTAYALVKFLEKKNRRTSAET